MAQAILLKEVEGLGAAGQAVDVSSGYLRNYLIPRKLAQPATTAKSLVEAERRREVADKAEQEALERSSETAALLSKTVLTISHRAGEDGKLFGSVSAKEIAEAISDARNLRVDPKRIRLERADPRGRHLHGRRRDPRRCNRVGQDDHRGTEITARGRRCRVSPASRRASPPAKPAHSLSPQIAASRVARARPV